jgi:putative hydrolase of the HAD superfamily
MLRSCASMTRPRAVLLDALGTLLELVPPWPRLRQILMQRHGIEVSEDDARRALLAEMAYYRAHHQEGSDSASLAELRLRCAQVLRDELAEVSALDVEMLKEVLLDSLRFVPYPDAAGVLAELRGAGLRSAVVSNWDCSLPGVLAEVGLGGAVDAVVVSAEVGTAKPDPRIFRVALERLRRAADESIAVGDSLETDVAGAQAAGIRAVLLDRAGRARAPAGVERVESLSDVLSLVAQPSG